MYLVFSRVPLKTEFYYKNVVHFPGWCRHFENKLMNLFAWICTGMLVKSISSIFSFLRYSQFKRVLRPDLSNPYFDYTQPNNFRTTFNMCEVASICKGWDSFIDLLWRNSWFENPPYWLIGEHFGLYLRNKIFPKYRICAGTQQVI